MITDIPNTDNLENLQNIINQSEVSIIESDIDNHELSSEDSLYTLSLRVKDFESDKELRRFIKSCEIIIRKSPEYKVWTSYIREVLGFYTCDLTKENHAQCVCDIHHHPMSLFTITKAIIMQHIAGTQSFCSADIAVDILELHYQNRIGFVSLIRSLHEKFHNGYLNIPMEIVHGDYKYFIDHYGGFLEDEDLETIQERQTINFENCGFKTKYFWANNDYIADNATVNGMA